MELFGEAEIYLASHHWPIWGNERIVAFLGQQRDMYQYIHDQTVRLFNAGMTPGEIAENLELPESMRRSFPNRGYYGTTRHNARAVYQAYLGWYDGNPANLNPLPPVEAAKRYVALAGGADSMLQHARDAFERAEYRWVAELLNHLIFAQPGNREAREILAASYDQLGYQSESGPWRDVYLTAAYELRHGEPQHGINIAMMEDILRQIPVNKFFESMATRLNGPDAEGLDLQLNIMFTDLDENYLLDISNSVLHHRLAPPDPSANATLKLTHGLFVKILTGQAGLKDMLFSDELELEGSSLDLMKFFSLLDKPEGNFSIVTP
jgi:alkyl sulfatase BDS1-like metallo-beta-lactamase superfamily hydrolase